MSLCSKPRSKSGAGEEKKDLIIYPIWGTSNEWATHYLCDSTSYSNILFPFIY